LAEKTQIGPHRFWFEPDTNFVVIEHVGTIDEAEATALLEQLTRTRLKPGDAAFYLADHRRAKGVTKEARKVFASSTSAMMRGDDLYVATFGATLPERILFNLFFQGLALTMSSKVDGRAVIAEEDARAWLSEQRRRWLATNGSKSEAPSG